MFKTSSDYTVWVVASDLNSSWRQAPLERQFCRAEPALPKRGTKKVQNAALFTMLNFDICHQKILKHCKTQYTGVKRHVHEGINVKLWFGPLPIVHGHSVDGFLPMVNGACMLCCVCDVV